ncbi:MAG: MraY family glycosyltransferase [Pirellulales bacterium]|nr:MraY family glycosyltransferase [Pirellulales bacterium]
MGFVVIVAVLSSLLLTPLAMRAAWKCGAISRPDGFRKKHARPTPEWGGIAVNTAILIGIGLSAILCPADFPALPLTAALAVSIAMLSFLGCYDDLCDMRADLKLFGQVLSVVPLLLAGCYAERLVLFGQVIELGWLGIPWTVGWIVLGINALNLIDGMDGLASTVGIIIALAIAAMAAISGQQHATIIALVLAGALGGFLAHNLPPARIYLGDCGSMVIGLVLATLALHAGPEAGAANLTHIGALLFVPLCDTLLAIVRRGLAGRGIMAADRGHVHHRLLDRGLGVWGSLAVLGGLSLGAGAMGCLVVLTGQEHWAWLGGLAAVAFCVRQQLFGHEEWGRVKSLFVHRAGCRRVAVAGQTNDPPLGPGEAVDASAMAGLTAGQIAGLSAAQHWAPTPDWPVHRA